MARAVHYAHQRGILHRDLKPANILLDEKGEPHVTDFGLAKRVEDGSTLTQSGAIVGTPSYMAPEQARAEKGLSTAVDIYSLGAILYELLTGQPPFRAQTPLDTILQVLEGEPVPPASLNPAIDRDLATICLKCLEKDPQRRYPSAEALGDDLERWRRGEPILARPSSFRERTLKWARRRPALAALLLVSATSLVILLALATSLWQNAEKRAEMVQDLQTAHQDLDAARQERTATIAQTRAAQDRALRVTYDADMQFAHAFWNKDNAEGLLALLERHRPQADQEDLRGFEWHYLWRLGHGERHSWQGHVVPSDKALPGGQAPVMLAFSPDGKTLASASLDQQLKLWDSGTGKLLRAIPLTDAIASIGFTPDGKDLRLVVASKNPAQLGDFAKIVQEVKAGTAKSTLEALLNSVALRILPLDGDQPARTEALDPTKLQSLNLAPHRASGPEAMAILPRMTIPLKGQIMTAMCLASSPDGKTIAISGILTSIPFVAGKPQETALLLWDVAAGKDRAILKTSAPVQEIAFSPDGKALASAGFDRTIRLWDPATGQEKVILGTAASVVMCLAFSRDGKILVSGSADGTVKLWPIGSGQLPTPFVGHVSSVTGIALSKDGRTLASASADGVLKLWDTTMPPGPGRTLLEHNVLALGFPGDGKKAAVMDYGGKFYLFDPLTDRAPSSLPLFNPELGIITGAIAPDSKTVAMKTVAVGEYLCLRLIDATSGKEIHGLPVERDVTYALTFSPDGKVLAAGRGHSHKSGEVVLLDAATGKPTATLKGHGDHVVSLAFSPDGKSLVSGSLDQTVKVWDVAEGKEIRTIQGHGKSISAVAFSRDGTRLATADGDTLSIRKAATGKELLTIRLHSHHVVAMSFNVDGSRLATAGGQEEDTARGGGVKLWDLTSGQEVLSLGGSSDTFTHVAFSPDGRTLIAARRIGGFLGTMDLLRSPGEVMIWNASDPSLGGTP